MSRQCDSFAELTVNTAVEFLKKHLPFECVESRFALEKYNTESTGVGLRAIELIPKNAFVFEYGGESITFEEAERREKQYVGTKQGCYMYFCETGRMKVWYNDALHASCSCAHMHACIELSIDRSLMMHVRL
jgi:hypothetical protein